jgi:hypothetical protein
VVSLVRDALGPLEASDVTASDDKITFNTPDPTRNTSSVNDIDTGCQRRNSMSIFH